MNERMPPETKSTIADILEGDRTLDPKEVDAFNDASSLTYGGIQRIHEAFSGDTLVGDRPQNAREVLRTQASQDLGDEAVRTTVHLNWG